MLTHFAIKQFVLEFGICPFKRQKNVEDSYNKLPRFIIERKDKKNKLSRTRFSLNQMWITKWVIV